MVFIYLLYRVFLIILLFLTTPSYIYWSALSFCTNTSWKYFECTDLTLYNYGATVNAAKRGHIDERHLDKNWQLISKICNTVCPGRLRKYYLWQQFMFDKYFIGLYDLFYEFLNAFEYSWALVHNVYIYDLFVFSVLKLVLQKSWSWSFSNKSAFVNFAFLSCCFFTKRSSHISQRANCVYARSSIIRNVDTRLLFDTARAVQLHP